MAAHYDFLETVKRVETGSKVAKALRRNGKIPGIFYYKGEENIKLSFDRQTLLKTLHKGGHIFELDLEGTKQYAMIKEVQYHPVTDDILHIDLYGVKMDEKITVKVSIHLTGDATGVKEEGGVLNSPTSEIEVSCFPMDIIGTIDVDVTELSIGDSMQVGDVKLDDKHTLMSSPDAVVASVTHAMREEEPVVEEEGEDIFMDEEGGETAADETSGDSGESTDSE